MATTEVPMIVEVDCSTGESVTRAMTKEEQDNMKAMQADHEKHKAEQDAIAKAEAEAKASALTKLTVLGLTVEEVKAILK